MTGLRRRPKARYPEAALIAVSTSIVLGLGWFFATRGDVPVINRAIMIGSLGPISGFITMRAMTFIPAVRLRIRRRPETPTKTGSADH